MITLTASARCHQGCPLPSGDPETVDKAADKHTRTEKHATAVTAVPALRAANQ